MIRFKIFLLCLVLIVIAVASLPIYVFAFNFTRSLTIGSSGNDVLELQRKLNQDPDTRVANFGVGSPGNETTYFGNLTKNAVLKFQNKYSAEVLAPLGLSYGTGYFGPSTIKKINSLEGGIGGISIGTNQTQNAVAPLPKIAPRIDSVSPRSVKDGEYLTIKGEGFNDISNLYIVDIYHGANFYDDFRMSDNGKILKVRVQSIIPYTVDEVVRNLRNVEGMENFTADDLLGDDDFNEVDFRVITKNGESNTGRYNLIINEI